METKLLPLKQAPMDGTPIYVRTWDSYRYQPYSPKSQEYKRGRAGRWQTSGEYGGWENCQAPKGSFWSADHTVFDAVDARLIAALSVQKQLVEALEAASVALYEASDKFHILSGYIKDEAARECAKDRVDEMSSANAVVRAAILAAKASS